MRRRNFFLKELLTVGQVFRPEETTETEEWFFDSKWKKCFFEK